MEIWVMGIRVRVAGDDPLLLEACAESLSVWRGADPGPVPAGSAAPAIEIEMRRRSGTEGALDRGASSGALVEAEPLIEVEGTSLRLAGQGGSAVADAVGRRATCVVDAELARDRARMATDLVDPVLLFLLTRSGRVPIHAAGVLVGDTAVALAGTSGVGKSTLALAALEAGIPILSDDAVYVQIEPATRVWGYPRPVRVEPAGRALADRVRRQRRPGAGVAEYAGRAIRNGKEKAALLPPAGSLALVAERGALCLLTRGDEAAIRPIDTEEALSRIRSTVDPGFDHFLDELPAAVSALAEGGCWELTVSPDLAHVLAILRDTFHPL